MPHEGNSQPEEVDPAFVALVESYSAAVEDGRMDDVSKASAAVMEAVWKRSQANPDPKFLRSIIVHCAEADCQWDVLRRMYTEDLEAVSRDTSDRARPYLLSNAYKQLAHVESCTGNHLAAFEMSRKAVEGAREGDSEMTVAMALESHAGYALAVGQTEVAIAAADEGLRLLPNDRSHGVIRTQLLVRRADAELVGGNCVAARKSAQAAWAAIEPWSSMREAAGVQITIARLWRIEAKLRDTEQRAWPDVREAWELSVAFHRHVIDLWQNDGWVYFRSLATTLNGFAAAAELAGELQRANSLRDESNRLKLARGLGQKP
jgi:hypothetical protein